MLQIAFICCLLFISGCEKDSGRSGPPTASQTSKATARLSDRVKFLQQYVTFRREYVDLEYNVVFQNNGGGRGIPGPSDWDIRIVATVPPEQIQAWVPADAVEATAPRPNGSKPRLKKSMLVRSMSGISLRARPLELTERIRSSLSAAIHLATRILRNQIPQTHQPLQNRPEFAKTKRRCLTTTATNSSFCCWHHAKASMFH